jgi:hypothetical protein
MGWGEIRTSILFERFLLLKKVRQRKKFVEFGVDVIVNDKKIAFHGQKNRHDNLDEREEQVRT